jgi:chromosome segregation ATPase
LLPIVNEEVEGTKLSVYNERVHAKYPLNGFRLKNSTALHLMQGPITVFDGGAYAGDARIEDLPPGQERLISYAIDLKAEVEPLAKPGQQPLVAVSIRKGTLLATRKAIEEKIYNVKNRDQKKKEVLIEHPFRADWQLAESGEPAERTREVYRFAVMVDAGQHAQLRVREEKSLQQTILLTDAGPDLIASYVQAEEVSPKVKEALQKVVALRDRLDQTTTQRNRLEQRINEITQEQGRIRENMARLAQNSELYNRYVSKLDQQETDVEKLRQEIETLKATEDTQRKELNDYLLGLDIS